MVTQPWRIRAFVSAFDIILHSNMLIHKNVKGLKMFDGAEVTVTMIDIEGLPSTDKFLLLIFAFVLMLLALKDSIAIFGSRDCLPGVKVNPERIPCRALPFCRVARNLCLGQS